MKLWIFFRYTLTKEKRKRNLFPLTRMKGFIAQDVVKIFHYFSGLDNMHWTLLKISSVQSVAGLARKCDTVQTVTKNSITKNFHVLCVWRSILQTVKSNAVEKHTSAQDLLVISVNANTTLGLLLNNILKPIIDLSFMVIIKSYFHFS